jgi:hypothetical protein
LTVACNNEDLPEDEPSVAAESETGVIPGCWEPATGDTGGFDPANPTLFQCVGVGNGQVQYLVCEEALGCDVSDVVDCNFSNPGDWTHETKQAGPFEFPPTSGGPNSQACCDENSQPPQLEKGCRQDCRRAACNEAIATLQAALDDHINDPPDNCKPEWPFAECYHRVKQGLEFWIKDLQENFDQCLKKTELGQVIVLPNNPDVDAGAGALACGRLELSCAFTDDAYDLEQACTTSLNEPQAASALILECDIDGDIEVDGPEGNAFTTFEGTVILRKENSCTDDSCWFSIDSLEIDADAFADSGYIGRDMHASLAYPGVGTFDSNTDEGVIAWSMLGLEVTMEGLTPTSSLQSYGFKIGNSDAAIFELAGQQFEIVDAYFAWEDHDLFITSDVASCTCVNCSF